MTTDPIRIRVTRIEPAPPSKSPRDAFWANREVEENERLPIATVEARLVRAFGPRLRSILLREISEPLRSLDTELFPRSMRDWEHWAFRSMGGPKEFRYQFFDAFSRLLEQRQQMLRESPALRVVQERLAAAAGVTFSTRIAGYSSLNLELSVGSIKQVARAFEHDFDSFRVFLDAFIPTAFAQALDGSGDDDAHTDAVQFSVSVPTSMEAAFRKVAADDATRPRSVQTPHSVAGSSSAVTGETRARAEWLWRLANGSLLVPVVLALLVLYQGMRMLADIRGTQFQVLQPILDHQLKLLEEDRHRMSRDAAPAAQPTQSPSGASVPSGK